MPPQDPFGPDSEYLSPDPPRPAGSGATPTSGRPRRRWSLLLLAVVVLLLVETVIVLVNHGIAAGPHPDAGPATTPPSSPGPTEAGTTDPTPVYGPPIWVTTTLSWVPPAGLTGRWDLLARGSGVVVRLSPATGTVSRIGIPQLGSSGPVSFLATATAVLVRPLDHVAGYVVPDGGQARPMAASLAEDGPMLPGPDPSHVWVASPDDAHPALVLKPVAGGPGSSRLEVPTDSSVVGAMPDGAGYALFATERGLVDVRPDGSRVVSRGTLLASGPRSWLVRECVPATRCTSVLIDQASLARADLGVPAKPDASGAISPDGRFAVLVRPGSAKGSSSVELVGLASPTRRVLPVAAADGPAPDTVAWSPDGRWLFVLLARGGICVVDAATGAVRDIGVQLPTLVQLAIRSAA